MQRYIRFGYSNCNIPLGILELVQAISLSLVIKIGSLVFTAIFITVVWHIFISC